ncbi:predicted protein [Streptomyces filamentosus NRRL 15998]|uniref:Predicted protein n=1 Tax=Streptomyces filamentosus NRRL 15998 TaxID=457431 RepID=D6ADM0_STRFL|nr:predicted protein [Streptomyces filamentosus NRRL 15998]
MRRRTEGGVTTSRTAARTDPGPPRRYDAPCPYRMPMEYAHFLCMCRAVIPFTDHCT